MLQCCIGLVPFHKATFQSVPKMSLCKYATKEENMPGSEINATNEPGVKTPPN